MAGRDVTDAPAFAVVIAFIRQGRRGGEGHDGDKKRFGQIGHASLQMGFQHYTGGGGERVPDSFVMGGMGLIGLDNQDPNGPLGAQMVERPI